MAENGKTSFSEQLDRMRHSMKKSPFAASQEYRAVMNALQDVVNYQGRSVGETSKEMVEAHSRLGQACETYLRTREGARTSRGKSRLVWWEQFTVCSSRSGTVSTLCAPLRF